MKKETRKDLGKQLLVGLLTITGLAIGILQIFAYFIGDKFFFATIATPLKFVLFSLIIFVFLLMYILIYLYFRYSNFEDQIDYFSNTQESGDSLVLIINNAYKANRWAEVIKIGRQLSEPLWYTGKFKIRVKIGELVESAAAFLKDYEIQGETLIDDLGWTNFRLLNHREGLRNIGRGLNIAEKISNPYLIAKANRHYADIAVLNNKLSDYPNYIEKAAECCTQIVNPLKNAEMHGNLNYTRAKYYLKSKMLENSMNALKLSQSYYQKNNDLDREVKLLNLEGQIYLAMGKENLAIDSFQNGLTMATNISNIVHMVSNSLSLAEYYYEQERYDYASKMFEISLNNSHAMDDPVLIKKINRLELLIRDKNNDKKLVSS